MKLGMWEMSLEWNLAHGFDLMLEIKINELSAREAYQILAEHERL